MVLRIPLRYAQPFAYGTITPCGEAFQPALAKPYKCYSCGPTTPGAPSKSHSLRYCAFNVANSLFICISRYSKKILAYADSLCQVYFRNVILTERPVWASPLSLAAT